MKSKLIVLLTILILIAACQKRKYPEEKVELQSQDVFFNGSVDNTPFSLKIGTDGYYCYSSYNQNSDGIYMFEGELKKFNCNPCPVSLQVELSDYKARTPGAAVPVDSTFKTGTRNFIPGISKTQTIKFTAFSNKTIASLHWNWDNGSSQDSVMNCAFGQPGPQTVSLTVRTLDNCESMVVNQVFIGGASGFFACSISATSIQNNLSQFKPLVIGGKAPYHYTWIFGDGETSNDKEPAHTYKWAGSYPVKLRVVDDENHSCESNYIHVAGNDNSSCTANMSLSYGGSEDALLNGVRMQWTDQSNVIFRSDSVAQPSASYFEVLNSQAYAPNERGEAGRLLTLRFNMLVSDGNKKIWLKSDNVAIVVTYK